jgi:hypothetical protein
VRDRSLNRPLQFRAAACMTVCISKCGQMLTKFGTRQAWNMLHFEISRSLLVLLLASENEDPTVRVLIS